MAIRLKPLEDQVIVITGASSGIGLVTARLAAKRGARLVLASRNDQALQKIQNEIQDNGGQCVVAVADVAKEEDVRRISDAALQAFGGFDTWVNNAGISIYGKIEEVSMEDHHRLFDTNFWGQVHGSRIACETLRQRGGALINIGSAVSQRSIPLQSMYSASKHAVAGFTEALRLELEHDQAPVSVTLIMPGSIDTPFPEHAKSYTENEPTLPPPVYSPDVVARAILYAAEHPERTITVGLGGKLIETLGNHAPWLMDKVMEWTMVKNQQKAERRDPLHHDNLYRSYDAGRERGHYEGMVQPFSVYTQARLHPLAATMAAAGLGLGVMALIGAATGYSRRPSYRSEGSTPSGAYGSYVHRRGEPHAGPHTQPQYVAYQEEYRSYGQPPEYHAEGEPDIHEGSPDYEEYDPARGI